MEPADLTISDSELVAQARAGEEAAFESLVQKYHGAVFAIGLAHFKNADEAEDLAQEVFLRAFVLLADLNDGEKFGAWLGRMSRNLATDWLRRGASRQRLAPQIPLDELLHEPADSRSTDVRQRLQESRSSAILMEHIAALPVHLREVVLLCYMEGLTQQEAAVIQGVTQGAVASRLNTALRKLRGALEPLLRDGLGSLKPTTGAARKTVLLVGALLAMSDMARAALVAQAGVGLPTTGGGGILTALSDWLLRVKSMNFAGTPLAIGGIAVILSGAALVLIAALFPDDSAGFRVYRTDTFTPPPARERSVAPEVAAPSRADTVIAPQGALHGWIPFGVDNALVAGHDYDEENGAVRVSLIRDVPGMRRAGWYSPGQDGVPLSVVGDDRYVRVKYYVYADGQNSPDRPEEIPNIMLRAASRFAVMSELEIHHHRGSDSLGNSISRDLRPSSDPRNPSLYRLDFAPVMVPYLRDNASEEGILRGMLAFSSDPQANGSICMAESVIGTYHSSLAAAGPPIKVYAPDEEGAGDLRSRGGDLRLYTSAIPRDIDWVKPEESLPVEGSLPTYSEGTWGVTMDTTNVAPNRLGVISREFWPGDDLALRVRAEEDKQYKVRFHVTSTLPSSTNAMVRLRVHSAANGWVQKLDLLGSWGMSGPADRGNNAIAQQTLPGIGSGNPDQRTPGEPGGWYTLLMPSPMSAAIRPEFPKGTPLAVRMPGLAAEPGPGDDRPSNRDLIVGADLIDTLSRGDNAGLEKGNMIIDRIEIYEAPMVED